MRKVLFVHDGPRWKNSIGHQFGTKADLDMQKRFEFLGEKVEFVMRVFPITEPSNLLNLTSNHLKINEIKPFNRPHLLLNYFKSRSEIHRLVDNADIIIARLPSTIGSIAAKYAQKINKPIIIEVVACPWDTLRHHSFLGKLYAPFGRLKLKNIVKNSYYTIYVTAYFLQNRYPSKSGVFISDVVLAHNLKIPEQGNKMLSKNNYLRLTSVGIIDIPYKGHQYVIEAMSILKSRGIETHYTLVGGGDSTRLKAIARKNNVLQNITFLGKVPHEQIFNILKETDVYIQPSECEGMPRALIEAMSVGCVCLGSNVGGIPELLSADMLFKSGDIEGLASKLMELLQTNLSEQQSQKNIQRAMEFSPTILESKRNLFYTNFLNEQFKK
jgi:glycosyltransferase involved in cell wall biosynthesis